MRDGIGVAQNQPSQLELLAAQRCAYANAKRLIAFRLVAVFGLALWSTLAFCFPGQISKDYMLGISLGIFLFDIGVIEGQVKKLKLEGAIIKEAFDTNVFELMWPSWCVERPVMPERISYLASQVQDDKKNELKNWYPAAISRVNRMQGALLCQRTNLAYGFVLRERAIFHLEILGLLVVLVAGCIFTKKPIGEFAAIFVVPFLPLARLALRSWRDQQDANADQKRILGLIDKSIQFFKQGQKQQQKMILRQIQDQILSFRKNAPVVFDWYYRIFRKENEQSMENVAERLVQQHFDK